MNTSSRQVRSSIRRQACRRRDGFSVVLMLGMISITLALSYSLMRSQANNLQIQDNVGRQTKARQAAMAGLSIALSKMRQPDWQGVDVPLKSSLNSTDAFHVTFQTGDASLQVGDPDWEEFPYRVTVRSEGSSYDPSNNHLKALYHVEAVVQLVRRSLNTSPASFDASQDYTLYQWEDEAIRWELHTHIEGPVMLQGVPRLAREHLPDPYRPLDGVIDEVAVFPHALSAYEIEEITYAAYGLDSVYDDLRDGISSNSPKHWWQLEDASNQTIAKDQMGLQDGNYEAGALAGTRSGMAGTGVDLNGIASRVNLGNVEMTGTAMSILAAVQVDNYHDYNETVILSKSSGYNWAQQSWRVSTVYLNGVRRLRFILHSGGVIRSLIAPIGDYSAGQWLLVGAVYDGTTMRLYLDGSLVGWRTASGSIVSDTMASTWIGDQPPGSPRKEYLSDLEAMRQAGEGDFRPLSGALHIPPGQLDRRSRDLFEQDLGITVHDASFDTSPTIPDSRAVERYRLYPGGIEYEVPRLEASLNSDTYAPDMKNNPLGIFLRAGSVTLGSDVAVRGTLFVGGGADLRITGQRNQLQAVDMPALVGDSTIYRLPTVIAQDDFYLGSESSAKATGLVLAFDDFYQAESNGNNGFQLTGKLQSAGLFLPGSFHWHYTVSQWVYQLAAFQSQLNDPDNSSPVAYYPQWIKDKYSLGMQPRLSIQADDASVQYHWQDWTKPVYVPAAGDSGLQWDLIRWTVQ